MISLPKLTAHRPTSTVPGVFSTPNARGAFHVYLSGWDERRELSVIALPPSLACCPEGDEGIPFLLAPIDFPLVVVHSASVSLETAGVGGVHCSRPSQRISKPQATPKTWRGFGVRKSYRGPAAWSEGTQQSVTGSSV
ncbi:hypothetical protein B5X24_HaOG207915 [Helicoverpa armigera]|uniref:Uncharacterized protein n=1 Tax=Helicoverpa armigera TaxID=29058 RepID=A0A2W1BL77_HELAM|nr:hypothetical protein B5X24_HaOG207915 [Helicoverpa armigera]